MSPPFIVPVLVRVAQVPFLRLLHLLVTPGVDLDLRNPDRTFVTSSSLGVISIFDTVPCPYLR